MERIIRLPRQSGAAAADTTTRFTWLGTNKLRVKSAYWDPDTATASDGTDYVTVTALKGSTTLGSHASSSAAYVDGTEQALTLSASGKDLEVSSGDTLGCTVVNSGSGKAHGGCLIVVADEIRS